MNVSRMALIFLFVSYSAQPCSSTPKILKTNSSVFKNPFDGRFVGVITKLYASHRRLCGPNQQLGGDTFEYSSDCCEKKDNKCISKKQCRRPVADCVFVRSDGSKEVYKSTGVKECGQCMPADPEAPAEIQCAF